MFGIDYEQLKLKVQFSFNKFERSLNKLEFILSSS